MSQFYNLAPSSNTPKYTLPPSGTYSEVVDSLPFGVYASSDVFITGAVNQVKYVYQMLGGKNLDIELCSENVYASYERATLEYSSMINSHQAKNILYSVLGYNTGTFDSSGQLVSGDDISLKYPRFTLGMTRDIGKMYENAVGVGGNEPIYSCSFDVVQGVQDYDLDTVIRTHPSYSASFSGTTRQFVIRDVFYKAPNSMWRFFGYMGTMNAAGFWSTYGQYGYDASFYLLPASYSKLQGMTYEDSIYTRASHYSYRLVNNKLRIFPVPGAYSPTKMWFEFSVPTNPWSEPSGSTGSASLNGINNVNTIPFGNIPYENINSIGKQFIRDFSLAVCKEILGNNRSKYSSIPIPNGEITLNGADMVSQGREEQKTLKENLKALLDELVYSEVSKRQQELIDSSIEIKKGIPLGIYIR